MKVLLRCCIALLLILGSVPAEALEPLVLYDNFNEPLINPAKWLGRGCGSAIREAVRQIQRNRLRLVSRTYGNTDSDTGARGECLGLDFPQPASITATEAMIQVNQFVAQGCASNPNVASVAARLAGHFFNTGTPTPGSSVNDVGALIEIARVSNSSDPKNVLRVKSFVFQCADEFCSSATTLFFKDHGTIDKGQRVRVRIQWDLENNRFIFQRDDEPEVFAPYTVSDTAPPGVNFKILTIDSVVPNCTKTPRPVGFIEVLFEDVFVNESAAP